MSIQQAFECESKVRQIITQQEINGINFDAHKAERYISELGQRKDDLYAQIRPHLDLEIIQPYTVPVNEPFLKGGGYRSTVYDWYLYSGVIPDIRGAFTRVCFAEPNLGSRIKLISQLIRLGWKPISFTEKGNPKLTVEGQPCPSLMQIDSEIGGWIAHWYIYNHRQGQIQGWLNRLRHDGKLTAEAITIGTPTYRFRHKIIVNVPKSAPDVLFGKEMRSLFIADEGDVLVGHDASGLELRMLAHYMNDSNFTEVLLSGDIHTKNQNDAGLPTRDDAKTFIYALNYGAGNKKLGSIIGGDEKDGAKMKAKFLKNNPALKSLIKRVRTAAKRGYLIGLDGRKILLRRDKITNMVQAHKAPNTLLQCAGALVMKYAMINLDEWIREMGLRSRKVIDSHDEAQYSVHPHDAELHGILARYSIIEAGRQLNLRIPLDAEAKIGASWAVTH